MAKQTTRRLSRTACLRLLATSSLGRVVITVGALPSVHPVSYVIESKTILFRTSAGFTIDVAARGDIVALQVDNINKDGEQPWTVMVVGPCKVVTTLEGINRFPPVTRWAPLEESHLVRITMTAVSGRHLGRARSPVLPSPA